MKAVVFQEDHRVFMAFLFIILILKGIDNLMKKSLLLAFFIVAFFSPGTSLAHFGMVIPSDSMVMQGEKSTIHLTISFSHPMEMVGMDMAKPKALGVLVRGEKKDLLAGVREKKVLERKGWEAQYKAERPGSLVFYMEPEPYWEPAEDCFIVHYTKTVAAAFGDEEGWDAEVGLKAEIIPLARPFGLYAGNVFQGLVKVDGKPVPYAEVEVEYYNRDRKAHAPTDYMITQSLRADGNGVFTFAVPKAGWWGFAALSTSGNKISKDGKEKDVELGAVIWVEFKNWQEK
jgi:cobalt/nickel transport protein